MRVPLISLTHHVPDYLGVVTALCDNVLRPGVTVVTLQDPLWCPRQRNPMWCATASTTTRSWNSSCSGSPTSRRL